jgi:hypothetical protein
VAVLTEAANSQFLLAHVSMPTPTKRFPDNMWPLGKEDISCQNIMSFVDSAPPHTARTANALGEILDSSGLAAILVRLEVV